MEAKTGDANLTIRERVRKTPKYMVDGLQSCVDLILSLENVYSLLVDQDRTAILIYHGKGNTLVK